MSGEENTFYFRFRGQPSGLLDRLFVEVRREGSHGISWREVGLDQDGCVVHRMPSAKHRHGDYGLFDNAAVRFDLSTEASDLSAEEFEALWREEDLDPPPASFARIDGMLGRIRQEIARDDLRSLERERNPGGI